MVVELPRERDQNQSPRMPKSSCFSLVISHTIRFFSSSLLGHQVRQPWSSLLQALLSPTLLVFWAGCQLHKNLLVCEGFELHPLLSPLFINFSSHQVELVRQPRLSRFGESCILLPLSVTSSWHCGSVHFSLAGHYYWACPSAFQFVVESCPPGVLASSFSTFVTG